MITFDGVTKRFGATVAIDRLDLEVAAGRITVFVGPSGGGKTTALRMVNRMIDPTSGRVLLDGADVQGIDPPALRRGIGYVIQQAGLFPHRTVADNIATVPLLLGWGRRRARDRAEEMMRLVGLDPALARRYPYQLSGGQQQRVGVARALAADPPVLLMDEPFSAVDPVVRAGLQDELVKLQAELHKTILLVTHDVEEAIRLGDSIAVFRPGGRLAQVADPATLLAEPADDFVESFVGFDRGIRRLSFFPTEGLKLTEAAVVAADTPCARARERAEAAAEPWLLAVDADRRPLGWIATAALPDAGTCAEAPREPYGHTFAVGRDSLRAALDAAVLSPAGRAVGVDGAGRVVGVIPYEDLRAALPAAGRGTDG